MTEFDIVFVLCVNVFPGVIFALVYSEHAMQYKCNQGPEEISLFYVFRPH